MSKVFLDHVPARTPMERRAVPPAPPSPARTRIEAGVLALVLAAVLVFTAGFAVLFSDSTSSPTFWPTYRAAGGAYEVRYPRGWNADETSAGVRLSNDVMTVVLGVHASGGRSVQQLAQERIAELGDLGAAEATSVDGTFVGGEPAAAIRELATGDGRVSIETFVQLDARTYARIAATAAPGRFDQATYDSIVGTITFPGPDVHRVEDRVDPTRD